MKPPHLLGFLHVQLDNKPPVVVIWGIQIHRFDAWTIHEVHIRPKRHGRWTFGWQPPRMRKGLTCNMERGKEMFRRLSKDPIIVRHEGPLTTAEAHALAGKAVT